jgi:hypothetical protein
MVAPPSRPLLDSMPWRTTGAMAPPSQEPPQDSFIDTPREVSSPDVDHTVPSTPASETSPQGSPAGDLEHRIVLRFGVSPAFMSKLDRVRSLAWHRLPANATLEHVFELVIDDTLKRSDPVARREQRSRRELARTEAAQSSSSNTPVSLGDDPPRPRQIPLRDRDEVFARDNGRCTYVGPDGRRCDATRGLQIDHIVPVAHGGGGEIGNLRLLCAQHNRLLAERLLGLRPARRRGGG